jgi:metallo-beta-lactamase family protein
MECMRIKFLGAAGQVTGSSFLLTSANGEKVLIDLGMFQGGRDVHKLNFTDLQFDAMDLTGVLLTHAHLDHCGRLPLLVKNGYTKEIFMTRPTIDITEISLFDTAHINEEDKNEAPLFSKEDVEKTVNLFKAVEYDRSFNLGTFSVTYRDAGHIIGSASIEITDNGSSDHKKIVFSGDLGNTPEELIKPTEYVEESNVVVMETTYGDRTHPLEDVNELLLKEVLEIEKNKGTLLIPSFSIERSQEIVHRLGHLKIEGKIKEETLIFFDSPMGEKVTQVFERYVDYFNKELSTDIKSYDPFHFPGISYTKNGKESRDIVNVAGPKIIIAGSGMMTGGRIVNHAITFLPDPTSRILFVGYQAEDTLGRHIIEGERSLNIEGTHLEIKASVNQIHSLSSHADQPRLLNWLKRIKDVNKTILIHGEDPVRTVFADKIKSELSLKDINIPNLNEEIEIN